MSERNKGKWPYNKETRSCNLGDCPAFKLTPSDMDYQNEATKLIKLEGKTPEEILQIMGPPMGTCLVTGKRVIAVLDCTVNDDKFLEYFRDG